MGHSRRLFADTAGLTERDVEQLARDGLASRPDPGAPVLGPIHGIVLRHGKPVPYTLDLARADSAAQSALPEQIAIAALVLASFIVPICYLVG